MSHYDWLHDIFPTFLTNLGYPDLWERNGGIIGAHGDKCYGYRYRWDEVGIPFEHGAAMYLLSYMKPWSGETRKLHDGTWVDVGD